MISGTLVNSMLAYMSLFHFEEAMKCADLLLDSFLKDPEIYFRKIQVRILRNYLEILFIIFYLKT